MKLIPLLLCSLAALGEMLNHNVHKEIRKGTKDFNVMNVLKCD